MSPANARMGPKDTASYAFLAIAWGLSFVVILKNIEAFGPIGAVAFRCFVAAAVLTIITSIARHRMAFRGRIFPLAVVGATTVAGQLLGLTYGTPRIGTAMAAIFVAAIPLYSMVMAVMAGTDHFTRPRLLGLFLGIVGVTMLVGFPAVPVTHDFVLGCLAMVFSTLCAAFGSVYANVKLQNVPSADITVGAFIAGGVITLPFLAFDPVPRASLPMDFVYLLISGGVMSAITYLLYFRLVATLGATRAISVEFVVTLVAVLFGALVLDEKLTALQIAGGLVIMAGCALVLGLFGRRRSVTP
jgi:drug/metabolite transporter (DMT)-like permease